MVRSMQRRLTANCHGSPPSSGPSPSVLSVANAFARPHNMFFGSRISDPPTRFQRPSLCGRPFCIIVHRNDTNDFSGKSARGSTKDPEGKSFDLPRSSKESGESERGESCRQYFEKELRSKNPVPSGYPLGWHYRRIQSRENE